MLRIELKSVTDSDRLVLLVPDNDSNGIPRDIPEPWFFRGTWNHWHMIGTLDVMYKPVDGNDKAFFKASSTWIDRDVHSHPANIELEIPRVWAKGRLVNIKSPEMDNGKNYLFDVVDVEAI